MTCCRPAVRELSAEQAEAHAAVLKALADPMRLRLLSHLAAQDCAAVCSCDLVDRLGISQPTVSHHMKRLVDAGFQSGHAYGKSLRMVKACLGTNWCRFGVQDSTTLAVAFEKRYRGLRSPHKIKISVSGCARGGVGVSELEEGGSNGGSSGGGSVRSRYAAYP